MDLDFDLGDMTEFDIYDVFRDGVGQEEVDPDFIAFDKLQTMLASFSQQEKQTLSKAFQGDFQDIAQIKDSPEYLEKLSQAIDKYAELYNLSSSQKAQLALCGRHGTHAAILSSTGEGLMQESLVEVFLLVQAKALMDVYDGDLGSLIPKTLQIKKPQHGKILNEFLSQVHQMGKPAYVSTEEIGDVIVQYGVGTSQTNSSGDKNFLPAHPALDAPNWTLIEKKTGVVFKSVDNILLYDQLLEQYALDHGLSAAQVASIKQAYLDPSGGSVEDNVVNLKIVAKILANNPQFDSSFLDEAVYQNLIEQLEKKFHAPDLKILSVQDKEGLSVFAREIAALMLASSIDHPPIRPQVLSAKNYMKAADFGQGLILGATTNLQGIQTHPESLTLIDFLSVLGQALLKFRNQMVGTLIKEGELSKKMSVSVRDQMDDQVHMLESLMEETKAERANMDAERNHTWIGAIIAAIVAAVLVVVAVVVSVVTFGVLAPAAAAATASGLSSVAAAINTTIMVGKVVLMIAISGAAASAMAAGFGFAKATSGFDLARDIFEAAKKGGVDEDVVFWVSVATTIASVILAAATMGALTNVASSTAAMTSSMAMQFAAWNAASVVASTGMTVSMSIMNGKLNEKIYEALKEAGHSEKAAHDLAMALTILTNVTIMVAMIAMSCASMKSVGSNVNMLTKIKDSIASQFTQFKSLVTQLPNQLSNAVNAVKNITVASTLAALGKAAAAIGHAAGKAGRAVPRNLKAMGKSIAAPVRGVGQGVKAFVTGNRNIQATMSGTAAFVTVGLPLVQSATQMATQIMQAIYLDKQARIVERKTAIESAQSLLQSGIGILQKTSSSIHEGGTDLQELVEKAQKNFNKAVSDLSKAVSAITSNTTAPTPASQGGEKAEDEVESVPKDGGDKELRASQISAADYTITAAPSSAAAQPGVESKMLSTTAQLQKEIMIAMLVNLLSTKLTKILQKMGIANAAEVSKTLIESTLKQIAKGNATGAAYSMSLLLSAKQGKNGVEWKDLNDPMEVDDLEADLGVDGEITEEKLDEMEALLKEIAEGDQELQSLLKEFEQLKTQQKMDPLHFMFQYTQLIVKALGMNESELYYLKYMLPDDEEEDEYEMMAQYASQGEKRMQSSLHGFMFPDEGTLEIDFFRNRLS